MTQRLRIIIWSLLTLSSILCSYIYGQVVTSFDTAGELRAILGILVGLTSITSVFVIPKFSKNGLWLAILLPALFARIALLPSAPSDDVHRYLWEGKLLTAGENVYQVTADHPSREPYRDAHWQKMNHHDKPTAYPPLALVSFALINQFSYTVQSYQIAFLALDLLLVILIVKLLQKLALPPRWAIFYSLSPLALIAFSAEAHFDILMMLPLVAATLLTLHKKWCWVGTMLALSVGFKIMAIVLVPLFLWKSNWRGWFAFVLVLALPLASFWTQLPDLINGVIQFGTTRSFNGGIYQILQWLTGGERFIANFMVAGLFSLLWVYAWFIMRKGNLILSIIIAFGGLVILSPTVHFWYIVWILPFIAIRPDSPWLSLSAFGSLYFLVWAEQASGNGWALPIWARFLFWSPFFLLLFSRVIKYIPSIRSRIRVDQREASLTQSVSIIFPCLNPGKQLHDALKSVSAQTQQADEIIIVDAGSTDGSLDTIAENITLLQSEKGRGVQIKTGVEHATSDWVIILHADALLQPNSIETLKKAAFSNPNIVGGAFGQRFDASSLGLLFVELLNEIRASIFNTSFGDQTQFYRRKLVLRNELLTDQPLMEDVEISDRIAKHGEITYLGNEVLVSASKWLHHGFIKRFSLVVKFYFQYRLLFWSSKAKRHKLSQDLVKQYNKPN